MRERENIGGALWELRSKYRELQKKRNFAKNINFFRIIAEKCLTLRMESDIIIRLSGGKACGEKNTEA